MTIIHIAEEEEGCLKHAFGLHAAQSVHTCDSNP